MCETSWEVSGRQAVYGGIDTKRAARKSDGLGLCVYPACFQCGLPQHIFIKLRFQQQPHACSELEVPVNQPVLFGIVEGTVYQRTKQRRVRLQRHLLENIQLSESLHHSQR